MKLWASTLDKELECLFEIVEETIRRVRIALRDEDTDLNEVEPRFRAFRDNTAPHFDLAALILLRTSRSISPISRGVAFPFSPFWISFRSS